MTTAYRHCFNVGSNPAEFDKHFVLPQTGNQETLRQTVRRQSGLPVFRAVGQRARLTENAMWRVQWDENDAVDVHTIEELDQLLDRLHQSAAAPVLATVEFPQSGDSLTIGLGHAQSVLNFIDGSGDPPYWSSVGKLTADGAVDFLYMGEPTEIPLRRLIGIELARDAIREFAQTGRLSKHVDWEEP